MIIRVTGKVFKPGSLLAVAPNRHHPCNPKPRPAGGQEARKLSELEVRSGQEAAEQETAPQPC